MQLALHTSCVMVYIVDHDIGLQRVSHTAHNIIHRETLAPCGRGEKEYDDAFMLGLSMNNIQHEHCFI